MLVIHFADLILDLLLDEVLDRSLVFAGCLLLQLGERPLFDQVLVNAFLAGLGFGGGGLSLGEFFVDDAQFLDFFEGGVDRTLQLALLRGGTVQQCLVE